MAPKSAKYAHETHSEAHRLFRQAHNRGRSAKEHGKEAGDTEHQSHHHPVPGVQIGTATGIIYVTDRAMANGYTQDSSEWSNMGQGAPEVGHIPGAAPKPKTLNLEELGESVHEYAPTAGLKSLREAVADYYNREFRQGKKKYTMQNVCIVPGGRAGLSRVAAVLGQVNLGYSVPVYSAYENTLGTFTKFVSIPTQTTESHEYKLRPDEIEAEIRNRGLSVFLMSNPNNPTGTQMKDQELKQLVDICKQTSCSLVADEFYSWYQLDGPLGKAVSAAEFVEDPDEDPIILIDGLTKNWRAPSWRVCWVVGPAEMVSALSASGSFLDGGASRPMQCLALPMLQPHRVEQDRLALQKHFRAKRDHVLQRLDRMGLHVSVPPQASFYIWVDLGHLPFPINSGLVFAEELLREKAIVTPGIFFDVNPSKRRNIIDSPCERFIRLSFGPALSELDRGLDAFERLIAKAQAGHENIGKGYRKSHGHAWNLHSSSAAGS